MAGPSICLFLVSCCSHSGNCTIPAWDWLLSGPLFTACYNMAHCHCLRTCSDSATTATGDPQHFTFSITLVLCFVWFSLLKPLSWSQDPELGIFFHNNHVFHMPEHNLYTYYWLQLVSFSHSCQLNHFSKPEELTIELTTIF